MRALVWSDRPLRVRMIASELNLNHTTIYQSFNTGINHEKLVCEECSKKPNNRTEVQSEGRVSSSAGTDPM